MTWNASLIDGPIPIPIYGDPITENAGHTYRPVIGYVSGYHVNVAPEVYTPALEPYRTAPRNPRRVFAGAETVFLKFSDEAEACSVLGAYWMEPTE